MTDEPPTENETADKSKRVPNSTTYRMYRAITRELVAKYDFEYIAIDFRDDHDPLRIIRRGGEGHATRWKLEVDFIGGQKEQKKEKPLRRP